MQLLAVLGSLVLVCAAEAAPVRPGTVGTLKDKIEVRSHVSEHRSESRHFAPDTLRVFNIYFMNLQKQFLQQRYTYLELVDSTGVVANVPVALVKASGMPMYEFSCAERFVRMSSFHFDGPNDYYEMDLMYWDDVGSPFAAQFSLRRATIKQGDVAMIDIVLSSFQDATLTFWDSCQIQYRVFDSNHEPVVAGPDEFCSAEITTIDLKRGVPKSFEMPLPSGFRGGVGANRHEPLAPGLYFVNCYVAGYGDLGLTAKLELTILPQ